MTWNPSPAHRITPGARAVASSLLLLLTAIGAACSSMTSRPPEARPSIASGPAAAAADIAPATQSVTTAPAPAVSLFGLVDHAWSIIVITDRPANSSTWMTWRAGITRFVDELDARQRFDVLFFLDDSAQRMSRDGSLLTATALNKKSAADCLDDVSGGGTSDPTVGLRIALLARPDVIDCIIESDVPDRAKFERAIHEIDPRHRVRINMIMYGAKADNEEDLGAGRWLKSIASKTGGVYRRVDEEDVAPALEEYIDRKFRRGK